METAYLVTSACRGGALHHILQGRVARCIAGLLMIIVVSAAHAQLGPGNLAIFNSESGPGGQLIAVDPTTSARSVISDFGNPTQGPQGLRPSGIAVEPTGDILLVDTVGAALFRVNPGTGARTVVSRFRDPAQGTIAPAASAVTVDVDSILVIDEDAITGRGALFRIDPATGVRSVVSDFGNLAQGVLGQGSLNAVVVDPSGNYLVTDNSYGSVGGSFRGAVYRVDPTSGVRTILSDFNNPAQGAFGGVLMAMAIDGSGNVLVLATTRPSGGILYRLDPRTGARTVVSNFSDATLGPLGINPLGVAVDGAGNIWVVDTEAGTAGRGALFSVDASTGVRTIASDFGDPAQGALGFNPWSVASVPTPPTQPVDLSIANIEITQAIQNFANDVPLVQDKATYVRVYPAVDVADRRVGARLRGFRGGVELPGSPLRPINPVVTVHTAGAERRLPNDSFNFRIPPSWRSGNVSFQAEINFGGAAVPETNLANNVRSAAAEFIPKAPVCVMMIPVRTNGSLYTVDRPGFDSIIARFQSLWPVPATWVYSQPVPVAELEPRIGIPPWEFGPYELPEDGFWVNVKLALRDAGSDDPDECDDNNARTHYVGMVSPDSETGDAGGLGSYISATSWVRMSAEERSLFNIPIAGVWMAHELSHNYNGNPFTNQTFLHVLCPPTGRGAPKDINRNYPYPTNTLGPVRPDAYWGFDSISRTIIRPNGTADYLSYCFPIWVSDYTWKNMFNVINPGAPRTQALELAAAPSAKSMRDAARPRGNGETLIMGGVITPARHLAQFEFSYRLSEGFVSAAKLEKLQSRMKAIASEHGAYALEMLASNGSLLFSQRFDSSGSYDGVPTEAFFLTVPFDPNTARIRITRDGRELGAQTVSAHAPRVELLEPAGRETITDNFTIRWVASDEDNDPLRYTVQYSANQGATWRSLVTQTPETTLTISGADIASIPGSTGQALVRVIANDGVNTGSATSAPFTVQRHPPRVHIQAPREGEVFALNSQIILTGGARDAEDGPLPNEALTWRVDNRLLGTGPESAVAGLTAGTHVITLDAVDSDGNARRASAIINVVRDMPVANVDGYTIAENASLTVEAPGVLENDIDMEGDQLNARLASEVSNGQLALNPDGSFIYTPNAGFRGSDRFTYIANDGSTNSNVVTVNLQVVGARGVGRTAEPPTGEPTRHGERPTKGHTHERREHR